MTIKQLIAELAKYDPETTVVVQDKNEALWTINSVSGLEADPNGDLYVALRANDL